MGFALGLVMLKDAGSKNSFRSSPLVMYAAIGAFLDPH